MGSRPRVNEGAAHQVAERDRGDRRVRHLESDQRPTGHRRQHAQRRGAEAQRQVVLARHDPVDGHARRRVEPELGDRRPLLDLDHPRPHVEARQRVLDHARTRLQVGRRKRRALGRHGQDGRLRSLPAVRLDHQASTLDGGRVRCVARGLALRAAWPEDDHIARPPRGGRGRFPRRAARAGDPDRAPPRRGGAAPKLAERGTRTGHDPLRPDQHDQRDQHQAGEQQQSAQAPEAGVQHVEQRVPDRTAATGRVGRERDQPGGRQAEQGQPVAHRRRAAREPAPRPARLARRGRAGCRRPGRAEARARVASQARPGRPPPSPRAR